MYHIALHDSGNGKNFPVTTTLFISKFAQTDFITWKTYLISSTK